MVARTAVLFVLVVLGAGLACGVAAQPISVSDSGAVVAPVAERDTVPAASDTTVHLPEVTVLATRTRLTPTSAPARLTILDRATIEETTAQTLGELLEDRSGAYVRNHGPGQLASLSLRGGNPSQTLLLLDGHRLSDPQLGQIDLSLLPTELLERVEVMHGAASPLYGSEGMSGVVNLKTRRAADGVHAAGTSRAGAFGERQGSLLLSGTRGSLSGAAFATFRTADNDFSFTDETRFPPESVRRTNADRSQWAVYGRLAYDQDDHRTQLSGWYNHVERGVPGPATAPTPSDRQSDERLRAWIDHERFLSTGQVSVSASIDRSRLRFASPPQDLDATGRRLTGSLQINRKRPVGQRWLLAAGTEGYVARARHPQLRADAHEGRASVYASGTGDFGRLTLFPAGRLDVYTPAKGEATVAASPKVGVNVQPFGAASPWRLKASVGRSFRQPTLNDRFWQPGGQPDLDPERGWAVDAGALWTGWLGRAELTAFAHFTRDEIVWLPTGNGFFAPENVRRTRTLGLEASVQHEWSVAGRVPLRSGATYTLTDARNRSDPARRTFNEPLRQVPRHQVKAHTSAGLGPLTLDLNARYVGRRYVTSDGSQSLAPHVVLDAQVRVTQPVGSGRVSFSVAVDNLLDSRHAVVSNRPMPPRHASATLSVAFGSPE